MLRRRISQLLLIIVVIGFVTATALSVRSFAAYMKQDRTALRCSGWIAAQAQQEYFRRVEALMRYRYDEGGADLETLALRLDIFWSRLDLMVNGEEAALLRSMPMVVSSADDIVRRLK